MFRDRPGKDRPIINVRHIHIVVRFTELEGRTATIKNGRHPAGPSEFLPDFYS